MNQFSDVLTSATEGVASGLDTQAQGQAIVVYNPLNIAREDVVEANLLMPDQTRPTSVRVVGPDGKETPAQVSNRKVAICRVGPGGGICRL